MATRFVEWAECVVPECDVDLSKAGGNNGVTGTGTVGDDQVDMRLRGSPDNYRHKNQWVTPSGVRAEMSRRPAFVAHLLEARFRDA